MSVGPAADAVLGVVVGVMGRGVDRARSSTSATLSRGGGAMAAMALSRAFGVIGRGLARTRSSISAALLDIPTGGTAVMALSSLPHTPIGAAVGRVLSVVLGVMG